jgi:hypothetical protein
MQFWWAILKDLRGFNTQGILRTTIEETTAAVGPEVAGEMIMIFWS